MEQQILKHQRFALLVEEQGVEIWMSEPQFAVMFLVLLAEAVTNAFFTDASVRGSVPVQTGENAAAGHD